MLGLSGTVRWFQDKVVSEKRVSLAVRTSGGDKLVAGTDCNAPLS
jgi:hypothetical protein